MTTPSRAPSVTTRELDLTGPTSIEPIGIPAGVVGATLKGPAYVPLTLPTMNDFVVRFGAPNNVFQNAPLCANEWLRNAQSLTFVRVLGIGDGNQRVSSGNNKGKVTSAGFVVGDQQPQLTLSGALGSNTYAVSGGPLGRTHFLGSFMSQSSNSTVFTDAGLSAQGIPIIRGVIMAASGVFLTLSSSFNTDSSAPSTTLPATSANIKGALTGSVVLSGSKQEFVMLLNGHKASDVSYPNVITASFDVDAPNYFGQIFNKDPFKLEQAGYYLYTQYDLHPAIATVTGSGVIPAASGSGVSGQNGRERIAFLLTGSQTRNSGSITAPNFENFEDRFETSKTTWVTSQKFGGRPLNLFQIWALGDGVEPNQNLKISIENIQPSNTDVTNFGTFDLIIRDFNDNDNNKVILEQWRGLSLNIAHPRFIGNIIGDIRFYFNFDAPQGKQKLTVEGLYGLRSRYIRVKLADDVINGEMPETALPMGFRGAPHLLTSGSAPFPAYTDSAGFSSTNPFYNTIQMPVPFRLNLTRGTSPTQSTDRALYWGVQFERQESATEPNSSYVQNPTITSFTKYFPNFHTEWQDVIVSENEGTADTAANGILDADRFNNNIFSLENIKLVYNSTSNLGDITQLSSWTYVRNGVIPLNTSTQTRALTMDDLEDSSVRSVAKFSFFLQGGFDGVRIFNENTAYQTNNAVVEEINNPTRGANFGATISAYNKALALMQDSTEVDVQLLAFPGIRQKTFTDAALIATENRFDAMLIFDIEERDINNALVIDPTQTISVNFTTIDYSSRGVNSSFGATYFPDVTMRNDFNRTIVRVPPSVAALGAFSKNDAVGFPWYAPAGFTRGALETTFDTIVRLNQSNMDALYAVNINPIVSFAGSTSPVIWGQKTVLAKQSSLDRVNVRRLLLSVRREVKQVANRVIFQPNREATLAEFSRLVNPIFKRVQDKQGIDNFKVIIDTTTTTQADIENRTIRGKIFMVPTKTLEFLSIDVVLTNQGNFINSQ